MARKYIKRDSTSSVTRETHIKTIVIYPVIGMMKIKTDIIPNVI